MNKSYLMLAVAAVALGFGAYQMQKSTTAQQSGVETSIETASIDATTQQVLEFAEEMGTGAEVIAAQTTRAMQDVAANMESMVPAAGEVAEEIVEDVAEMADETTEAVEEVVEEVTEDVAEDAAEIAPAADEATAESEAAADEAMHEVEDAVEDAAE